MHLEVKVAESQSRADAVKYSVPSAFIQEQSKSKITAITVKLKTTVALLTLLSLNKIEIQPLLYPEPQLLN